MTADTSEWPHVLKLFLRRLQPLAQALDVFIVRLVLLLVHFQQRPQALSYSSHQAAGEFGATALIG